ncbi:monocarboxylate transporter [Holotrichia oblita]|uniref:Monocarboxylate transporter n=1 Tax=Holotrichia oblita TaxID=644536 RepID=A0ACB9TA48_HOLOL|nr:monocarboxylate transporter [Holotrichia oblita]
MLIITAISGHTMVAALLLQPVRWHMKEEVVTEREIEANEGTTLFEEETKESEEIKGICNDIGSIHASMSCLDIHTSSQNNNHIRNGKTVPTNDSVLKRAGSTIVKIFDLRLLADPIFTNILVGLSIDFFVEYTYIWLIPFALMEGSLTVQQTATFMSVYAIADILFRLFAPFIGSIVRQPNRVMYIISLIFVVVVRTFLIFLTDYIVLLIVAAGIGAFRGMRLVYWSLVIPEYTSTERLAAAFGLLFTLNGFCLLIGGVVLGNIEILIISDC